MPRSGRLRSFIREYRESPRTDKLSFIPPFLILILELFLFTYAYIRNEVPVMLLTLILLVISVIEAIFVTREIHEHYIKTNFDKILTIRLDDFITEKKEKNVKKLISDFIDQYPQYNIHRNEIYHTTCQILETHEEEKIEKEIEKKLKTFIKRRKKANVDEIVEGFVIKFPKYKGYRVEIYEKTCQILGVKNNSSK